MYTVAIDPGIRGCGVAMFNGQELELAEYVKNPCEKGNGPLECYFMARAIVEWTLPEPEIYDYSYHEIVCEWPQVYTKGKGDNNDLLALAGVDAAIFSTFVASGIDCTVKHFLPKEWKGQTPKAVCHQRVKNALSAEEQKRIKGTAYLLHNVLDAVGIGLFALGRFSPKKIIS
jgi:hypothetical protein